MAMTDQTLLLDDYNGIAKRLPQVVRVEPASVCNLKCIHYPTAVLDAEDALRF